VKIEISLHPSQVEDNYQHFTNLVTRLWGCISKFNLDQLCGRSYYCRH